MVTRRDAMKAITLGTVGAALVDNVPGATAWANIDDAARPPAFAGTHKAKDLPFPPSKLKGFDEVMIWWACRRPAVKGHHLIVNDACRGGSAGGSPPE